MVWINVWQRSFISDPWPPVGNSIISNSLVYFEIDWSFGKHKLGGTLKIDEFQIFPNTLLCLWAAKFYERSSVEPLVCPRPGEPGVRTVRRWVLEYAVIVVIDRHWKGLSLHPSLWSNLHTLEKSYKSGLEGVLKNFLNIPVLS